MILPLLVGAALLFTLPSIASASVAGQFRVAIASSTLFPNPTLTAQRNSYIVLHAWETERAEQLKAANPSLEVLVYQNLSAMAQGTGPHGLSSSGVNFAEATTAHPEWFLTEAGGSRIAEEGYAWLWMADIGNQTYEQQWTANVIRLLRAGPWDGVMMDDTNTTARYHVHPQSRIAKYPSDPSYQSAVRSMLAYAGPAIQAAGKLAIPNIGGWSEYPQIAREWLPYVSGGMDEMFLKWSATPGEGYRSQGGWATQMEEIATTEQMGKRFLAVEQSAPTDTRAIRYGWASVLLAAEGHSAFTVAANYAEEAWSSEYEVPLGEPTAAATQVAGGAWKRTYANGLVVVNPTGASVSVSFGGTYSGSGLTGATGTTLGPDSAVILTGVATKSEGPGEGGSPPPGSGGSGSTETGTGKSEVGSGGAGSSGTGSGTGAGSGGAGSSSGGKQGAPTPPQRSPHRTRSHQTARAASTVRFAGASLHAKPPKCRSTATKAKNHGRMAARSRISCVRASARRVTVRPKNVSARGLG